MPRNNVRRDGELIRWEVGESVGVEVGNSIQKHATHLGIPKGTYVDGRAAAIPLRWGGILPHGDGDCRIFFGAFSGVRRRGAPGLKTAWVTAKRPLSSVRQTGSTFSHPLAIVDATRVCIQACVSE